MMISKLLYLGITLLFSTYLTAHAEQYTGSVQTVTCGTYTVTISDTEDPKVMKITLWDSGDIEIDSGHFFVSKNMRARHFNMRSFETKFDAQGRWIDTGKFWWGYLTINNCRGSFDGGSFEAK